MGDDRPDELDSRFAAAQHPRKHVSVDMARLLSLASRLPRMHTSMGPQAILRGLILIHRGIRVIHDC